MERKLKDSGIPWIGHIPEEWDLLRNKNVLIEKKEVIGSDTSYPLLSLTLNGIILRDLSNGGKFPTDFGTYKKVIPNDIVFCLFDIDETPRTIGLSNFRGMITGAYDVFKVIPELVIPRWIYYFYLSVDQQKALKPYYTGLRKVIRPETFAKIYIPVPPLAEQERIATYLDEKCGEIDELIGIEEQMISDLEAYRQAVITEAVTKGLNRNTPFKPSGVEWIGDMPKHWGLLAVKRVFHNLDYLRKPIASENRQRNNPIYDYYGASGVIDKIDYYNVDDTVLLIGEDGANLVMRNLPLIYKASGKIWVNNHAHILKPKKGYDYEFLSYLLEAGDYSLYITGMAQPKLSQENLNMFLICIPPLSEQQEIGEYLDSKCAEIDNLIQLKQEKIETLKEYRKSLIFEAVTGKIEIA